MDIDTLSIKGLDSLAQRHGIRLLLLFGSTISGQTHAGSDIDLALLLYDSRLNFAARSALHQDLQHLFPQREIDMAILNHADPLFLRKVTEQCRLLFGNPTEFYSLRMYAFRRYQDHRRFLDLEHRFIKNFLDRIPQIA